MITFENDTKRDEFQKAIKEIVSELSVITDCRTQINEIIHELYTSHGVSKPVIRKVAKLYQTRSAADFESETAEITGIYADITLPSNPS